MKVMMEESEADIKAKATMAIADDAESELLEALPALVGGVFRGFWGVFEGFLGGFGVVFEWFLGGFRVVFG